jgi:hypothetical protein
MSAAVIAGPTIFRGLYAAWRLARGDRRATLLFGTRPEDAMASFVAALLVLPIQAGFMVANAWPDISLLLAAPSLVVHALSYILDWAAPAAVLSWVLPAVGRDDRLFATIAAYNWCSALQAILSIPLVIIIGADPMGLAGAFLLALYALIAAYEWFMFRSLLGVSGVAAMLFVAGDFALALTLESATLAMLGVGSG